MTTTETAPKAKHSITLTRAALYLLEGCLQLPGPASGKNNKIMLYAKVWDKIRSANDRLIKVSWAPEGHDFEKPILRNDGESDADFLRRDVEWKGATKAWEDDGVTLTMNDKIRDACREVVEWVNNHHDDQKVGVKMAGKHAASLLVGLGICKPENDEEYEMEADQPPALVAKTAAA